MAMHGLLLLAVVAAMAPTASLALGKFEYPRAGEFVAKDRAMLVQFDSLLVPLLVRTAVILVSPESVAPSMTLYRLGTKIATVKCLPVDTTHCSIVDLSSAPAASNYTLHFRTHVSEEFTIVETDPCLQYKTCGECAAAGSCAWDSSHWLPGKYAWYTECVTSSRTDLARTTDECAALGPELRGTPKSEKYYYTMFKSEYATLYGLPQEASLAEMRMHVSEADVEFNQDTETFYPKTNTALVDTCSWNYFDFEQDDCQIVVGMYTKNQNNYSSDKAPVCTITLSCPKSDGSWLTMFDANYYSADAMSYSRTIPSSGPWSNKNPSSLGEYHVRMGACTLDRVGDKLQIYAKTGSLKVNVTYKANGVAGWRKGSGKIWLDPEHKNYFHHQVNFPRARVTGTVESSFDLIRPWSLLMPRSLTIDTVGYGDQNDGRLDYSDYINKWWWGRIMTPLNTWPSIDVLMYHMTGWGDYEDQQFMTVHVSINGTEIDIDDDKVSFVLDPETIAASDFEATMFSGIHMDMYDSVIHKGYQYIYNNGNDWFNLTFSNPTIALAAPLQNTLPANLAIYIPTYVTPYEKWVQVKRKDTNPAYHRVGIDYTMVGSLGGITINTSGQTLCEDMQIH